MNYAGKKQKNGVDIKKPGIALRSLVDIIRFKQSAKKLNLRGLS